METQPLLLSVPQVSSLLGVGQTLVRELIKTGEVPSVRVKRAVRVPRAQLEQWIERRTHSHRTAAELVVAAGPPPRRGPRPRQVPTLAGRHPKAYIARQRAEVA